MTAPEPSLADIERLRRHQDGGLSVMRGWEAFGVAPRGRGYAGHDDPIVRRLGTSSVHPDVPAGAVEDWPAPELHEGIAGFTVSCYADDPAGAFVKVWGPDRDAVEAMWHRVAALIPLEVWP